MHHAFHSEVPSPPQLICKRIFVVGRGRLFPISLQFLNLQQIWQSHSLEPFPWGICTYNTSLHVILFGFVDPKLRNPCARDLRSAITLRKYRAAEGDGQREQSQFLTILICGQKFPGSFKNRYLRSLGAENSGCTGNMCRVPAQPPRS